MVISKLVYENAHWYQCVALYELYRMHCVVFFILDLLKRYRQNTAKIGLCLEALYPNIQDIKYQLVKALSAKLPIDTRLFELSIALKPKRLENLPPPS